MSDTSSSFDPQSQQAQARLDAGTRALEQGDLESAAKEYKESLKIKDSAIGKPIHSCQARAERAPTAQARGSGRETRCMRDGGPGGDRRPHSKSDPILAVTALSLERKE